MAAGCIVIGYTGVGGQEYFKAGGGISIPDGDISEFADVLTSTIREYDTEPTRLDNIRFRSSAYICDKYSREKMRTSLLSAWQKFTEFN